MLVPTAHSIGAMAMTTLVPLKVRGICSDCAQARMRRRPRVRCMRGGQVATSRCLRPLRQLVCDRWGQPLARHDLTPSRHHRVGIVWVCVDNHIGDGLADREVWWPRVVLKPGFERSTNSVRSLQVSYQVADGTMTEPARRRAPQRSSGVPGHPIGFLRGRSGGSERGEGAAVEHGTAAVGLSAASVRCPGDRSGGARVAHCVRVVAGQPGPRAGKKLHGWYATQRLVGAVSEHTQDDGGIVLANQGSVAASGGAYLVPADATRYVVADKPGRIGRHDRLQADRTGGPVAR